MKEVKERRQGAEVLPGLAGTKHPTRDECPTNQGSEDSEEEE